MGRAIGAHWGLADAQCGSQMSAWLPAIVALSAKAQCPRAALPFGKNKVRESTAQCRAPMMVSVTVFEADFFSSLGNAALAAGGGVARSPGTTKAAPEAIAALCTAPLPRCNYWPSIRYSGTTCRTFSPAACRTTSAAVALRISAAGQSRHATTSSRRLPSNKTLQIQGRYVTVPLARLHARTRRKVL